MKALPGYRCFLIISQISRQALHNYAPEIKSFLLVYEAVKTTINDQAVWWGYMGQVIWV